MGSVLQNISSLDFDAFSDGQMLAKLRLCEAIENFCFEQNISNPQLKIYGSWIGVLPFLILTREILKPKSFILYEINEYCHLTAKKMLNHWEFRSICKIQHRLADCNLDQWSEDVDILVNTSCEDIARLDWFAKMPKGVAYFLQSTDQLHKTNMQKFKTIEDFKHRLKINPKEIISEEKMRCTYANLTYERWQIIGLRQ